MAPINGKKHQKLDQFVKPLGVYSGSVNLTVIFPDILKPTLVCLKFFIVHPNMKIPSSSQLTLTLNRAPRVLEKSKCASLNILQVL